MQEVLDTYRDDNYTPSIERRRNRGEVTISQSLGEEMGSLSLSYIREITGIPAAPWSQWASDTTTAGAASAIA
jgi:hypothetical protein